MFFYMKYIHAKQGFVASPFSVSFGFFRENRTMTSIPLTLYRAYLYSVQAITCIHSRYLLKKFKWQKTERNVCKCTYCFVWATWSDPRQNKKRDDFLKKKGGLMFCLPQLFLLIKDTSFACEGRRGFIKDAWLCVHLRKVHEWLSTRNKKS